MRRKVQFASTPFGEIAYEERGSGPPALFVHGVFLNGYLWRHVIERLGEVRRCVAIDLLAHGASKTAPDADLSFTGQAQMLAAFCDALELGPIDLVANDSGGGIAQIFAAQHPERLRTLTLTNCDVHDNWPPEAFQATMQLVREGHLKQFRDSMLADIDIARDALGQGYEHPERLSEETLRIYLEPLNDDEATGQLERWFAAMDNADTVAVEDELRRLEVPTLIVWGTGDVFFDVKWAHWLRDTIPGATRVIELDGAKLFFPEERPDELVTAVLEHWQSTADSSETAGASAPGS